MDLKLYNGRTAAISFAIVLLFLFKPSLSANESIDPAQESVCLSYDLISAFYSEGNFKEARVGYQGLLHELAVLNQWDEWYSSILNLYKIARKEDSSFSNYASLLKKLELDASLAPTFYKARYYDRLAFVLENLGKLTEAIKYQNLAYQENKRLKDYKRIVRNLRNLGIFYSKLNDHHSSILYAKELLNFLKEEDFIGRRRTTSLLFSYYYYAEEIDSAKVILAKLIELDGGKGVESYIKEALIAQNGRDFNKSESLFNKAEKLLPKDDKLKWQNFYSKKASFLMEAERYKDSKKYYLKSLEYLEDEHHQRNLAKEFQKYSEVQFLLGDYKGVLLTNNKVLELLCDGFEPIDEYALPTLENISPDAFIMEGLYFKARVFEKLHGKNVLGIKNLGLINEAFEKAIYCIDLLRQNYRDDQSKFEMSDVMSKLYDDAFAFNLKLYQNSNSIVDLNQAFKFSQLKKAFVFKSSRSLRTAFEQSGVPTVLAEEYFALKAKGLEEGEKISERIGNLKAFEDEITKAYPTSKRIFVSNPLSIKEVQGSLLDDQAMLHYLEIGNKLYVLIIEPNKVNIVEKQLPPDFLLEIEKYETCLIDQAYISKDPSIAEQQYLKSSQMIYNHVFAKVRDLLSPNIKSLTIVPDGSIQRLSFENLPFDPIQSWIQTNSMLISEYNFNYLHYTNQIISQSTITNSIQKAVSIGLDYSKKDDSKIVMASRGGSVFGELLYVSDELVEVSNIINGKMFLNEQVNKSNFIEQLKNNELVHFAGHAMSDNSDQSNSYLVLNPISKNEYETLGYNEVIGLNLNNELVTLSACNTNEGQSIRSEGILSMSRAFVESGVKSTLGSNWNAPDQISKKILSLFYKNLDLGMNKAQALKHAKLEFLTNDQLSSPSQRLPSYWSNWRLYGDLTPVKFDGTQNNWLKFLAGGILIFGIGFYILKKKNIS